MVYEGYGPSGVAVIVEALTDNKNRTAGDLRHYFDKCGGNLGQTGCVSFMFSDKGVIVIDNEDDKYTEDQIMEDCMEAGAEDFEFGDGVIEISATSDPNEFRAVREALEAKGYTFVEQISRRFLPPIPRSMIQNSAKKCRNFWICWKTMMTFRKFTTNRKLRRIMTKGYPNSGPFLFKYHHLLINIIFAQKLFQDGFRIG